ncbi:three-helix bundle dimerization domain-containing protein [Cryobacterium sp. TMT4-10]
MVDRLSQHFPGTPRDHITETVREGYRALSENPIRAYVPNLVEHAARTRLRREARNDSTAA